MTAFWAVISIAVITGFAVHGHRAYEAHRRRRRQQELSRKYEPPKPSASRQEWL